MSLRVFLVAAPLVFLFFPAFVVAVGINVTAVCTLQSYSWTFNSLGQSPCIVAANMLATCYSGSYFILALPPGQTYNGPTHANADKCGCSTVGYSLLTACVIYLLPFFSWSQYVANCTSTLPPSQFPNPVPAGIYVPHWAILDVTNENNWNPNEAYAAGDRPEYGAGAIFGPSGVYTSGISSAGASSTGSPSPTVAPKGRSSNGGAIAGGVVGGLAVVSIAIAVILYLRRSRASSTISDSFRPHMDEILRPMTNGGTDGPSLMMAPSSPYTPNEPTPFQGYAGVHSVDPPASGSTSLHVGSGNMHTSLPQTRRYHGLPMPAA